MGLLAAGCCRPTRGPLPGRGPGLCQLRNRQRHLKPAMARGPGPVRVVLRVRQLHLLEEEQARLVEDSEEQQQSGGDALGDESSMPLFVEGLSSVFEGQPRLSRTEQRLPGDGRSCWQSNALHRAVLPHRDNGLSERRVGDHFDFMLATAAATNPLPDVFLLLRTRGQPGKPSRAEHEHQHDEGGGDDPASEREEQQSTTRRSESSSTYPKPLPSTHPAEGSCQGQTAGRGHQPLLPSLHPVGENKKSLIKFLVLRFLRCQVLDKTVHFLVV